MKITLEVQGYEITIDETEEGVSVVATKDGETVEEMELTADEEGENGGEGEDFNGGEGDEDLPTEDEDFDDKGGEDDFEDEGPAKLESFSSFIKKRKL